MRELRPRAGKTVLLWRGGFRRAPKLLRHSGQNTRGIRNFPREERPQNIRCACARALSGENRAEGEVMKRGKPAR